MERAENKDLLEIIKLLQPLASFSYLMGSYGTPRFRHDSDLDLAAHFNAGVTDEQKWSLKNEIGKKINRDVDLVSLKEVDPIYARQVLETGRLLYSENPGLLVSWQALQMSKYIDLKMGRREIEENLLKRKKFGV